MATEFPFIALAQQYPPLGWHPQRQSQWQARPLGHLPGPEVLDTEPTLQAQVLRQAAQLVGLPAALGDGSGFSKFVEGAENRAINLLPRDFQQQPQGTRPNSQSRWQPSVDQVQRQDQHITPPVQTSESTSGISAAETGSQKTGFKEPASEESGSKEISIKATESSPTADLTHGTQRDLPEINHPEISPFKNSQPNSEDITLARPLQQQPLGQHQSLGFNPSAIADTEYPIQPEDATDKTVLVTNVAAPQTGDFPHGKTGRTVSTFPNVPSTEPPTAKAQDTSAPRRSLKISEPDLPSGQLPDNSAEHETGDVVSCDMGTVPPSETPRETTPTTDLNARKIQPEQALPSSVECEQPEFSTAPESPTAAPISPDTVPPIIQTAPGQASPDTPHPFLEQTKLDTPSKPSRGSDIIATDSAESAELSFTIANSLPVDTAEPGPATSTSSPDNQPIQRISQPEDQSAIPEIFAPGMLSFPLVSPQSAPAEQPSIQRQLEQPTKSPARPQAKLQKAEFSEPQPNQQPLLFPESSFLEPDFTPTQRETQRELFSPDIESQKNSPDQIQVPPTDALAKLQSQPSVTAPPPLLSPPHSSTVESVVPVKHSASRSVSEQPSTQIPSIQAKSLSAAATQPLGMHELILDTLKAGIEVEPLARTVPALQARDQVRDQTQDPPASKFKALAAKYGSNGPSANLLSLDKLSSLLESDAEVFNVMDDVPLEEMSQTVSLSATDTLTELTKKSTSANISSREGEDQLLWQLAYILYSELRSDPTLIPISSTFQRASPGLMPILSRDSRQRHLPLALWPPPLHQLGNSVRLKLQVRLRQDFERSC
ncbi:MAG: hypothetical protein AAF572_03010 [Cyanobacteria bacterium P01_B01_bin.77]